MQVRVENETKAEMDTSVVEKSFSNGLIPTLHTPPSKLVENQQEFLQSSTKCKLSREEERNLKKIRRKLKNRQTAQDSRTRKKMHLDNLEIKVKSLEDENFKLRQQVEQLKAQQEFNVFL